jgi:hypothetical protein
MLSLIEKNLTKICNENDNKEKEKINEKFYMILLCFIANYENNEKIKQEKIEKLLSEKKEYFIKIIPLYTQYYSNIKIPENYIGHNQTTTNLSLINSIIKFNQDIDKNLRTLEQLNFSSTPIEEIYKNSVDIKQVQKRLIMLAIGNISV